MKPILYENNETLFTSNGLGRLNDCITCEVTEERNGIHECDFTYPVTGERFADIVPGRIVGVTHDDTGDIQPFDIKSMSRPINGIVTFHATHISYRQSGLTVYGTGINSLSSALSMLKNDAKPANPFNYSADFSSTGYMSAADGIPRSVKQMLGGVEGSILDAYGGEYEFDRWNVILHRHRGVNRDFAIRYGLNMTAFQDDQDYTNTYTSCIPYWSGGDGGVIVVGNKVNSGLASYNGKDVCIPLDLTQKFESKPTKTQLQNMALSMMQSGQVNLPSQNISVDFVRLQDYGEGAGLEDLLTCRLCDSIDVIFPRYGMQGTFKIVKTVWDVLAGRYKSMELGNLQTSLADALGITQGGQSTVIDGRVYINGDDDVEVLGDMNVTGALTISGHSSAIGKEKTENNTQNIATGTTWLTTGCSVSLEAGSWIVTASISYASNATNRRGVAINSGGTTLDSTMVTANAVSGGVTRLHTSLAVDLSSTTTVAIYGFQNSGSALSQTTYMRAIRIA